VVELAEDLFEQVLEREEANAAAGGGGCPNLVANVHQADHPVAVTDTTPRSAAT
jgi:hypothetical protein